METQRVGPESGSAGDLSFLWLEITAKCNLECVHCYADSGPRHHLLGGMALDNWLTILRDASSLGCRQVQFIGGEPTLHPHLTSMISFAAAQNYEFIEVYTNATHLGEQLLQAFVQHRVHVAFSFYSDDPELRAGRTHGFLTGGIFDSAIRRWWPICTNDWRYVLP
jgi:MoaA/NifB/PqqE/SkfB family radical SAM enzyme